MSAADLDPPIGTPSQLPAPQNRPLPFVQTLGTMLAVALAWAWPLPVLADDLVSAHMAQHLLAMNGGALLLALAWLRLSNARTSLGSGGLVIVTALQFFVLMLWHLPPLFAATHHSAVLQPLMQVTTFGAAFLFWRAIFASDDRPLWLRIVCLMVTAKLFCLAGAILVFARRPIYDAVGDPARFGMTALSDQQLAGLLMVSACALIYVAVATGLFASWLMRERTALSGTPEPVSFGR